MRLLHRLYEEGAELFTCDVVVCEALSGGTDEHREVIARLLAPLDFVATDPERRGPPARRGSSAIGRAAGSGSGMPSSRRSLAAWMRRSSPATAPTSKGRVHRCWRTEG